MTVGPARASHEFHARVHRDGNTLAEALARLLGGSVTGGMAESGVRPAELAIASAFFSPKGLADLARHIDGLERVRLMLASRRRAMSKCAGPTWAKAPSISISD
jgi:hypothetical protein